jgi:ribonuclease E
MSVIIRTAGMNRTRAEIKRDFDYLVKLWNQIRQDTLISNAPALIYEESDIIKRAIRDQYTSDIDELIIEGDEGYRTARDFMKLLLPSHTPKIKHYNEATPLFYAYNVEEQLLSMHDPIVKLRSGGYIVINPTEALISVDVNSGRATGERNIEETALRTNMEAAAEVARQLRLRDLAGLIVIDFIDMMESRNRRAIEKAIKDALKADRAKIQLGRISPFGLLEMSRQRLRPSISETNMVQCEHCMGRGFIRSHESMSIQMIRALEKEASAGVWSSLRLIAPQDVALHLLNTKRDVLRTIEQRHSLSIQVLIGAELTSSEFNLEKMRRPQSERHDNERRTRERERDRNRNERQRAIEASIADEPVNDNAEQLEEIDTLTPEGDDSAPTGNESGTRRRSRRRRGGRNRDRDNRGDRDNRENRGENRGEPRGDRPVYERPESEFPVQDNVVQLHDAPMEAGQGQPQEGSGRPPRNRGGRGRRRWRDRDERGDNRNRGDNRQQQGGYESAEPLTDGNTLPAFATEERLPVEPPAPQQAPEPVVVSPALDSTQRGDAPAKKGWWQKMIELDD